MKSAFRIFIFTSMGILGGCSWLIGEDLLFDDSEYDYTKAKMAREMQVPASIGEANVQDLFMVPEPDEDNKGVVYGEDKEIFAPMQVLTLGNKVRANRKSGDSSAFVTEQEIRLWDIIQRYLEEENISIEGKDLDTGTIITGWQTFEDDSFWWSPEITGWRYRYQIKLESSRRPTEKRITVKILDAEELVDKTGTWQMVSDTKRHETEFLNSILGFMYVEDIENSRQLVGQSDLGGVTVKLGSDNEGNAALVTSAGFDHLWTRLPISLSLLNITVEDQDRSSGLFFINNKGDQRGFFATMAFWSEEGNEVLDIPEGPYRIQLSKKGDLVTMTFIDGDNQPLDAEVMAANFPKLAKAFRSRTLD